MPVQPASNVENNFTKGLITEATGLNFPENAATDCDNVEFTLLGDVSRRLGIDFEENGSFNLIDRTNRCVNTYKWTNAGGDGNTQILVVQSGNTIVFFDITAADTSSPISSHLLPGLVDLNNFIAVGGSLDITLEADFADGNGYLFIYHPNCEPLYCTLVPGSGVVATPISVQIRDFGGIPEPGTTVTTRPTTLTAIHSYNLSNQGWTSGAAWSAVSNSTAPVALHLGSNVINIGLVAGINLGDEVTLRSVAQYYFPGGPVIYPDSYVTGSGTVTAYTNPNVTINVTSLNNPSPSGLFSFYITETNQGFVDAWHTSQGNYPSNADVWWYFKNASGVFDPTVQANISLASGNAPQGHFIMNAFNLDRSIASGVVGLTPVKTVSRPSTGCWFQGRVWYTGVNASQLSAVEEPFYSWSENIYFSQVNVGTATNFGNCYQVNDPTSQNLFDILPTDGGVIQIQGSGTVYKLFPIQNGLLVFAANGVWFITGSQGIGFSAVDYTITKISSITSFSRTSFVNVLGLPYFWNEEGIYQVAPQQGGGLAVESVTVSTIATYYDSIPTENKRFARGAYHPVDYTIQWLFKDTVATSVTARYQFNKILNYNTYNKAWFPYTVSQSDGPNPNNPSLDGIVYIQDTGLADAIQSGFKYLASFLSGGVFAMGFADEHDEDYVDWASRAPIDYESFFVTGYKVRGQAMRKFQNQYINVFSRTNGDPLGYKLQGIWDYSNNRNSGRWSSLQTVIRNDSRYDVLFYRHKIRGHGVALQFKISAVEGMPFDIIGWSTIDTIEQGT